MMATFALGGPPRRIRRTLRRRHPAAALLPPPMADQLLDILLGGIKLPSA
jgi:hypothetical protein